MATKHILAAASGTRLECPVAIAIATGMRWGEILALRWSDLDEGESIAHVRRSIQPTKSGLVFENPKTRRSRRAVVLPEFLRPYLSRQREDQARAHATLMLQQGVHPKIVSERLGHASIGITLDTYSHVLPANATGGRGGVRRAVLLGPPSGPVARADGRRLNRV